MCYTLGDCELNDLNNPKIFPFLFLMVLIVKCICNQVLNVTIPFPNYCLLPQRHVLWNMVRKVKGETMISQVAAFCHRGVFKNEVQKVKGLLIISQEQHQSIIFLLHCPALTKKLFTNNLSGVRKQSQTHG